MRNVRRHVNKKFLSSQQQHKKEQNRRKECHRSLHSIRRSFLVLIFRANWCRTRIRRLVFGSLSCVLIGTWHHLLSSELSHLSRNGTSLSTCSLDYSNIFSWFPQHVRQAFPIIRRLSSPRRGSSMDFRLATNSGKSHGDWTLWQSTGQGRFSIWNYTVGSHVADRVGYPKCLG